MECVAVERLNGVRMIDALSREELDGVGSMNQVRVVVENFVSREDARMRLAVV
jgi:hypothetical protein